MRTYRMAVAGLVAVGSASLVALGGGPAVAAQASCDGHRATMVGTAGRDRLVGTPGRDVIVARGGDDVVLARGGDDVVCGGDGADRLSGMGGDDRLFAGAAKRVDDPGGTSRGDDVLDGGAGDDHLDIGPAVEPSDSGQSFDSAGVLSYAGAPQGVRVDLAAGTARGWGRDTIARRPLTAVEGSAHDDVLLGGAHADIIGGLAGADVVQGRAGDDLLDGEDIARRLWDERDADRVSGGAGDDSVSADFGSNTLHGGLGGDVVATHSQQSSRVYGGEGNDILHAVATRLPGYVIDGGEGYDDGTLAAPAVTGHPTTEVVEVRRGPGTVTRQGAVTGRVLGLESFSLNGAYPLDYYGTDAVDRVGTLDVPNLRAWTFGGDDHVTGSGGDDYVDGGPGTDLAQMSYGEDTCVGVEPPSDCEVTTP